MGSFTTTLCFLIVLALVLVFVVEENEARRPRGSRRTRRPTVAVQNGEENATNPPPRRPRRPRRPRTTASPIVDDPSVKLLDLHLNSTSAATTPSTEHVTDSGGVTRTCGKSTFIDPQVRVVNGRRASPHEFPWNAFLIIYRESTDEYIGCGSTLISNNLVLTAAHCCGVTEFPRNIIVQLGSDGNRMQYEYEEHAEEIIYHPDWYSYSFSHDFCLLKIPS